MRVFGKNYKTMLIIGLIVFELALFGGIFLYKYQQKVPEKTAEIADVAPSFDFEVTYTMAGFVPAILDVAPGSKVAFRNMTDIPLWTASDPFPTHTDYPEFNAKRDYAAGEAYIFEFRKTGTFGYGNDKKSLDHGVIRVIDRKTADTDIDKTPDDQLETRDKFLAMLLPNDPASVFKIIDAIEGDEKLARGCHSLAHDIGHRAYELYGFSGAMNVSDARRLNRASVQDICAGGYVHGILEEAALRQPDFKTNAEILCSNLPEKNRSSCFHGLGHAFMFTAERDLAEALTSCRSLGKETETMPCFEGIWMEFFWGRAQYGPSDTLAWDPTNPLKPCVDAKEDTKPACFLYSSFGYLRSHFQDYTGAVKLCTTSKLTKSDEEFCLKGIGITMISHFNGQHLERSEPFVDGLEPHEKLAFYKGEIGYASFSGISQQDLQTTCARFANDQALCETAMRTAE